VTHLRKIMLEELHRRNYAQTTIDCYVRTVEHFSRYFQRSPEQLGPQHIREYQAALFKKWKLAPNTVNQRLAALRFFYIQTLKRAWSVAETPYPKKVLKLPIILSQEEVARLINSALTPFHRIVLMTLYATGVRRAELARLKISDIDSQRMVIHIQGGKGRQDRDVMLSPKLLDALREYWRGLKRKPSRSCMSFSLCRGNWHHSPCRTRSSSTTCCFAPAPQLCSKWLAIPDIWAPRSVSSACCTPGIRGSNFIPMSIAWSPPVDSRWITPTGSTPATLSSHQSAEPGFSR